MKLLGHCNMCGEAVHDTEVIQDGVMCKKCHNDSWVSELLPVGYIEMGYVTIMGGRL